MDQTLYTLLLYCSDALSETPCEPIPPIPSTPLLSEFFSWFLLDVQDYESTRILQYPKIMEMAADWQPSTKDQ